MRFFDNNSRGKRKDATRVNAKLCFSESRRNPIFAFNIVVGKRQWRETVQKFSILRFSEVGVSNICNKRYFTIERNKLYEGRREGKEKIGRNPKRWTRIEIAWLITCMK